ncbi:MAG TPA: hypothetical protein DCP71_11775 [Verrucomicrobiales bacterium]|nr:hypothetical protein [Verrucomicrobiales bacterium]
MPLIGKGWPCILALPSGAGGLYNVGMTLTQQFLRVALGAGIVVGQVLAAPVEVELVMYEVPEVLWQAKFEGQFQEHPALKKRLDEEMQVGGLKQVLAVKGAVGEDQPWIWRQGQEQEFAEGWVTPEKPPAMPERLAKRFVGSAVEIQQEGLTEGGRLRVSLKLEHHLTPPKMRRISYANAATGAEREKLSVEYPQFDQIEWMGQLTLWQQWRQVTNVLRLSGPDAGAGPAMRYVVFIKRL